MSYGISVILPLYNKEKSINNTLQSVLQQTFFDFELIIVNDGSTDNSLNIVQSFRDERIKIITRENGGVSSARNIGIQNANSDWIAFVDGDDFWEPNYLEEMNKFRLEIQDVAMFGCAFDNLKNGVFIPREFYLPAKFKGIIKNYFKHAKKNLLFWPSSTIVSRAAVLEVGNFDERINSGEDIDLWIRIALHYKVAFYNEVLAHYNQDGPNRAMKRKHDFQKSFLAYMVKYKEWEINNDEFRLFINHLKLGRILQLFSDYNLNKTIIINYLKQINTSQQPLKYRVFVKFPYFIMKIIVYFLRKLKWNNKS